MKKLILIFAMVLMSSGLYAQKITALGTSTSAVGGSLMFVREGTSGNLLKHISKTNLFQDYSTLASPTFTGTVVLPTATSIGDVSSTEIAVLDGALDGDSYYVMQIRDTTYKTDNYTLILADAGNWLIMNAATKKTFTIPPYADVAFPIGTTIFARQWGAGPTAFAAGAGVGLRFELDSLCINTQYRSAFILKVATDLWVAGGLTD